MKTKVRYFLKNYIPFIEKFYNLYVKVKYYKLDSSEIFRIYYRQNNWGSSESVSGTGSEIEMTKHIRSELPKIIDQFEIKSILDIPCGDYNWMQHCSLQVEQYIGADIVKELVQLNHDRFNSDKTTFQVLDLRLDELPSVDLIFVRDLFIHLSYEDIVSCLQNIRRSGSKFLMTTTFPSCKKNYDIKSGGFRKINLSISPFNFPNPLYNLSDINSEGSKFNDKSMSIWMIKDI